MTEKLCGHGFSASAVSRTDAKLDVGLKQFAERSLEGPFPYLILDARYEKVRPVFVCSEAHVRAHVFLCMLACHAEWHMRRRLAPALFNEDDLEAARAQRASPVEPTKPSPSDAAPRQ